MSRLELSVRSKRDFGVAVESQANGLRTRRMEGRKNKRNQGNVQETRDGNIIVKPSRVGEKGAWSEEIS